MTAEEPCKLTCTTENQNHTYQCTYIHFCWSFLGCSSMSLPEISCYFFCTWDKASYSNCPETGQNEVSNNRRSARGQSLFHFCAACAWKQGHQIDWKNQKNMFPTSWSAAQKIVCSVDSLLLFEHQKKILVNQLVCCTKKKCQW